MKKPKNFKHRDFHPDKKRDRFRAVLIIACIKARHQCFQLISLSLLSIDKDNHFIFYFFIAG